MPDMMRAAVLVEPGKIDLRSVPKPPVTRGSVRLKVMGCGVCASNLGPWQGLPWQTYPGEAGGLGHEAWGIIDAVGDDVTGWSQGEHVTGLTFKSFAAYDLADPRMIVRIPAPLQGQAFPGEPIGCAMNIFRRSAVEPGQHVAIIGIGFLGAILTKLAAERGAKVIAISRRRSSLDLAEAWGAVQTIVMDDHFAIIDQVREATDGVFCERVIEAVGLQWPLDLASELVGEGGRLIIAGYHQEGPRQVNMQAWNWKGIDVINAHERNLKVCVDGIDEAVKAVADGRFDPSRLFTHHYELDGLAEALDATRDKPEGFVKALINCQEAA